MAVRLSRGQNLDLGREVIGLDRIRLGLSWDRVKKPKDASIVGALMSIFKPEEADESFGIDIDLDASVFLLGENGKVVSSDALVYYKNETSSCGSIVHSGDNRDGTSVTGRDDEAVRVRLSEVPGNVRKLAFVVNIHKGETRGQHFGMVKNAYIYVVNEVDGSELVRYDLNDKYDGDLTIIVAELYRDGDSWSISALGEGTKDGSLTAISKRFV